MASPICGLHEAWSDPFLPLWRFQESQRPLPSAMTTMSMDRVEKTRRQPRQGSSLRPHPIRRDRAVLSRGRACRCYALACGRGTHEFARPLARPLRLRCMRNLLFGKLYALAGAAIGGFGVQIGHAFAKLPADNEAVLLENRTAVVSVTGRQDGYSADLLPHNLKVIGSNPIPATTFVITHSPSRSNRRDGFGLSEERSGRATEQVRLAGKCDRVHRE
jgi:hypothetical protein